MNPHLPHALDQFVQALRSIANGHYRSARCYLADAERSADRAVRDRGGVA